MLTNLHIENYKSIHDLDIDLGRINVFIGENGCGKSNILEALAFASAAKSNRLRNDDLAQKGIRVTRPDMMVSSFVGARQKKSVKVDFNFTPFDMQNLNLSIKSNLYPNHFQNILSKWIDEEPNLINDSDLLEAVFLEDAILHNLENYLIYEIQTNPLRGFNKQSYEVPGRNGENLDLLIEQFNNSEWKQLIQHSKFIDWLDEDGILVDRDGSLDTKRLKLRSDSKLYFRDRFMQKKNNVFSVENANEGALHILFYLALFISHRTPSIFAIDNIENALNPYLCRHLMKNIIQLAKNNHKQALITTHNPAVLDGLNLHDDEQRLFVVKRNKKGHTVINRIQLKPEVKIGGQRLKLSELWMRNHLGGIPQNF